MGFIAGKYQTSGAGVYSGYLQFGTSDSAGTIAERMRIDSSGNVGIGTTSPSTYGNLAVYTAASNTEVAAVTGGANYCTFSLRNSSIRYSMQIRTDQSNAWVLRDETAGANRLVVDTSGNLLVGTTDTGLTSGAGIKFINGASSNAYMAIVNSGTDISRANYHLYSTGAGAYRFYVTMAGVINATSTSITAISDQRLKENIRNLDIGLSEIMALKPRKFDWKEGKGLNKKDDFGR
jgi:hypothetical protein